MSLYDLTVSAMAEVDTYCYADIDEWRAAIDPVLKAAGMATVMGDKVEELTLDKDDLLICTSYSVRGCHNTNHMRLPLSIIKADNPIQAAYHYELSKDLAQAKQRVSHAQSELDNASQLVALLEAKLMDAAVEAPQP